MIEVDAGLQPFEVSDLGGGLLFDLISDAREVEWRAARRKVRLAYQLCVTNPAGPGIDPATWGDGLPGMAGDFDHALGGTGTPLVAVFVTEDWAAVTRTPRHSAKQWLANTLDLHHRLHHTHARVEGLELEVWRAFRLGEETHDLSLEAARWIDRLHHEAGNYSFKAVDRAVKLGTARFHPEKLTEDNPLPGRDDWDVTVDHNNGAEGTSTLEAIADSLDLAKFHDLVSDEAATMGRLVHPDTGTAVARRKSYLKARLFGHLSLADLATMCANRGPDGVVETNMFGPATTSLIRDYLDRLGADASVTPVIDTSQAWSVARHDPPTAMRDQVTARDRQCVHPYCGVNAKHCDLDHIVAYDESKPPGQTNPENLAPLCRRHHLLKTRGGWRYQRNRDGTYTWTNQHGRIWLVAPFGTTELTD